METGGRRGFWSRPTADIVVILFTLVVMIVVLLCVIGVVIATIFHTDLDVNAVAMRVGTLTTSLISAIVGFIAGRGTHSTAPPAESHNPAPSPQAPPPES